VPALQMILGADGKLADESQAGEFLRFTASRGVPLSDLWLGEADGRLLWATLPIVSPGRTMLLLGASARWAKSRPDAVSMVIESVCRDFAQRDVQLAQVLIDPADQPTIDAYVAGGFARMAELLYLQRHIRRAHAPPPLPAPFAVHPYSDEAHAAFAAAIAVSYEDSLDCPPLNGVRSVEDIIAGHKSAGEFDPNDWFVVTHGDQAVAVLLLSRTIHGEGMELVYLGLSPQVRGFGIGDHLVRMAFARVLERKLSRLTLAVDSQNAPALRLYHRHGMQRVASKIAMMRELIVS
jgi:ribosomal protein S18 acetylase RimI-like enzyme